MLPEQRGAYIDLLAYAWGSGDVMPCLDNDEAKLASMSGLGTRWKKLGALVRAQFDEVEGKLYNAKLTEVWTEQQIKHGRAIARASAGGKAKARKRGASSTEQVGDENRLYGRDRELEEAVEAPKGLLPASAPVGALALEGARAPALLNDGSSRPWVATEPDDPEAL